MVTVLELFDGRRETISPTPSAEIPFVVFDAVDEAQVKSSALAASPKTYANMPRKELEVVERINNTTWKIVARYDLTTRGDIQKGEIPKPIRPRSTFSFDTTGATEHITVSRAASASASAGPPQSYNPNGNPIGFDGQHVQGLDITVPIFNFGETHRFRPSRVSTSFITAVYEATGKVNSGSFRGFGAGDVLFLGASGTRNGNDIRDEWEITFRFSARRTEQITVPSGDSSLGPLTKRGWDYVNIRYGTDVDSGNTTLLGKPVKITIEIIYRESAFAFLGIGS